MPVDALYIENDSNSYNQLQSIYKNLTLKQAKGQYNSAKAAAFFKHLVDGYLSRVYGSVRGMSVEARKAVARDLRDTYETRYQHAGGFLGLVDEMGWEDEHGFKGLVKKARAGSRAIKTGGKLVFHAATRGGKYEIKVMQDAPAGYTWRSYTNGSRDSGGSGYTSKAGIAKRIRHMIGDALGIDGINYRVKLDKIGLRDKVPVKGRRAAGLAWARTKLRSAPDYPMTGRFIYSAQTPLGTLRIQRGQGLFDDEGWLVSRKKGKQTQWIGMGGRKWNLHEEWAFPTLKEAKAAATRLANTK